MKIKQKILALALAIILVLTAVPVAAVTSDDLIHDGFTYTVDYESQTAALKWYSGSSKEVLIPEHVDGYSVTKIFDAAFYGSKVERVVIPNTVTAVGALAFADCKELREVIFSENITSFGEMVFLRCEKLEAVSSIPQGVTDITEGVFSGCKRLKSVELHEGITVIGDEAFYDCTCITELNIPEGLEKIGRNAFANTAYYKSLERDSEGILYIGDYLYVFK